MSFIKFCRISHAYLCIFFFPMACIYAITGVCYISGYKGRVDTSRYAATFDGPPPATAEAKDAFVKKVLAANGIPCPKGEGKEMRNTFIVGRPTRRHAVLEPLRGNSKEAIICVNTPNLFATLTLLHKAKGGSPFNVFGITFSATLLLMYLSGLLLFWTVAELRTKLALCFAGGLIVTIMVIIGSV